MIEVLAERMAESIKRRTPDHPASVEVLEFSLSLILNVVFIVAGTLLLSVWTGHTKEAAVVLFGFAALRQLTGGVHLKSGTLCVFYSTAIFTVISVARIDSFWTNAITSFALILVLLLAPSGIDKQSRIPSTFYPAMKLIAAILVASNFFVQSPALSLCFAVQSVTLIPTRG